MNDLNYCGNTITSLDDIINGHSCGTSINSIDQINSNPGCGTTIEDLDDITGLMGYYEPRGKHICELDDAALLQKNDCFLLTKANTPILSSNKCLYSTFEARVFDDVMDGISVKTMAWQDKYDYSLTSHNHDDLYSKVIWIPNSRYQGTSNTTIGSMEIVTSCDTANKVTAKINVPVIDPPPPPQPMIGTFKFVSAKTWAKMQTINGYNKSSQINPYDSANKIRDDFDGWVWANGTTIQNKSNQLSAAAQLFAGSSTATSFAVPDFSRFFKANPKTTSGFFNSSENKYIVDNPTLGLPNHTHTVTGIKVNATLTLNSDQTKLFNKPGINDGGSKRLDGERGNNGFHHGNPTTSVTSEAIINPSSLNFPSINLLDAGTDSITESNQPYPKHNIIPVMIYIGGVTGKYFENISR